MDAWAAFDFTFDRCFGVVFDFCLKGICLIINNKTFTSAASAEALSPRSGTDCDRGLYSPRSGTDCDRGLSSPRSGTDCDRGFV